MAASSREARRRRILQQGSDRLALITGRIQTIPHSSSNSKPPYGDAGSSSQPLIANDQPIRPTFSDPISTGGSKYGETGESDFILQNHDPVNDLDHSDAYKSKSPMTPLHKNEGENEISSVPTSEVEHVQPPYAGSPYGETGESDSILQDHDPVNDLDHSDAYKSKSPMTPLHKNEGENEISGVPTSEVEHVQPPYTGSPYGETGESDSILLNHDPVTDPCHSDAYKSRSPTTPLHNNEGENEISSVPTPEVENVQPQPDSSLDSSGARQQSQPQTKEPKLFSEISSAINASRSIRLCCSAAVALLVVASYIGFPILGINFIKSLISFRPLYLVLVTNLTVMVARLLSSRHRRFEGAERGQNRTPPDGDHWAEQLARTFEAGLVMQNLMDAMFMDCAIYVIIVICGLSLVQT